MLHWRLVWRNSRSAEERKFGVAIRPFYGVSTSVEIFRTT
jgi:hypothetical protein